MGEMVVCHFFAKNICPKEDQNGGNGERGGDLILQADENVADLRIIILRSTGRPKNGEPGGERSKRKSGGDPCILESTNGNGSKGNGIRRINLRTA